MSLGKYTIMIMIECHVQQRCTAHNFHMPFSNLVSYRKI